MPLSVKDFANKVRERKPEYSHLDDTDLVQMVAQKKPELLKSLDRSDLALTMRESRAKKITRERQKTFGSLSGYDRFMSGTGAGMLDVYQGVKQLFGGDVKEFQETKKEYMEASEGDVLAGTGEVFGALAATAPTMLVPGVGASAAAAKLGLSTTAKVATGIAAATASGAGFGASELVDEGETRLKNAIYGGLFGAAGAGAGMLVKKIGTKAFNALKGKMKNASIQELTDLSKKYDIPLSKGDITGEGRATEKALEGIPGVGMGGFRKEGAEKVQKAIKKEAGKVGADWDETIQESLQTKAKAGKKQAKINYDRVSELAGDIKVPTKKTQKAIDKVLSEDVLQDKQLISLASQLKDDLGDGSGFNKMRRARSKIGSKAKDLERTDSDASRQLILIKKALEGDMENFGKNMIPKKEVITRTKSKLPSSLEAGMKRLDIDPFAPPKKALSALDVAMGKVSGDLPKSPIENRARKLSAAWEKADLEYRKDVVPYTTDRKIMNALKSDTPDEIFNTFIKKDKGDRAKNFYKLLDDKGKKALRDGFMDNAIQGATKDGFTSPAKLAGYLERMSKPAESVFKGDDLKELQGFAKIMRHAERFGQLNESPSNGMALIPYLKGAAFAGAGYGGATSPVATGVGVIAAGALTKIMSLMKTKGKGFSLASSEIGSKNFEKQLTRILKQLPKVSAVTAKEIED